MNKFFLNNTAFTLAEVLIATSISAVAAILLVSILTNNTSLFYKESAKLQQGLGINDSLAKIRSQIKQSSSIAPQYPETGSPIYTSSSEQLVLRVPAIDSSGNVIPNTFDYAVFVVLEDKLYEKILPDVNSFRPASDQILASNTDNLNIKYLNSLGEQSSISETVKVIVTIILRQRVGLNFETHVATTEANLRND